MHSLCGQGTEQVSKVKREQIAVTRRSLLINAGINTIGGIGGKPRRYSGVVSRHRSGALSHIIAPELKFVNGQCKKKAQYSVTRRSLGKNSLLPASRLRLIPAGT